MYPFLPTAENQLSIKGGKLSRRGFGLGTTLSEPDFLAEWNRRDQSLVGSAALKKSFQHLATVLDEGIACLDTEGRFCFVNKSAEKIFGRNRETILRRTFSEAFPTLAGSDIAGAFQRVLRERHPTVAEDYFAPSYSWVKCRLLPDDELVLIILNDVTNEKVAEWRRRQVSAIMDSLSEAIILLDQDARVVDWKGCANALFNVGESEARRIDLFSLIPFPSSVVQRLKQCMADSTKMTLNHVEVERSDGVRLVLSGTLTPLSMDSGRYDAYMLCLRDVTQGHRLYENLLAEKTNAEDANKSKSIFMANMSHEIRTPIAVILGYLQRLQRYNVGEQETKKMLSLIEKNTTHLKSLLDDLLDLSAVDSGGELAHFDIVSVSDLIQEVTAVIAPLAERQGLELKINAKDVIRRKLKTDASKMRRVLINLMNNAVKYTDRGFVELTAIVDDKMDLVFRVRDSGRGIKQDDKEMIFEVFSRCENARKIAQGFGLGLALSRKLAGVLGGSVQLLRSEIGEGSEFEFRCPCQWIVQSSQPDQSSEDVSSTRRMDGISVLLVEDSPEIAEISSYSLSQEGANVTVCHDGRGALSMLTKQAFDVVLLDYELPDMDAPQVLRELRAFNSQTPVVAVTAHTQPSIFQRLEDAGIADILVKPCSIDHMVETLLLWSGRKQNPIFMPAKNSP